MSRKEVSPGMLNAGINGFGRFGMHLLQYWVDNYSRAQFEITKINDDFLSLKDIEDIVRKDEHLTLKHCVEFDDNGLLVHIGDRTKHITYTSNSIDEVPWLGEVDLFLECSGKHTEKDDWRTILKGNTKEVIVSATSWTADQILVYGYNHHTFDVKTDKVVSYGSCTVNAYIPLAKWVDDTWGIADSDVNVIHNVPVHHLKGFNTLERRSCTLEQVAPHLLSCINKDNFTVTYTLVPYAGVSMMDYRFRLTQATTTEAAQRLINKAVEEGGLKGLFGISPRDNGPEEHKFTQYSAVLIEPGIKVKGHDLYLSAYFDNENSVNRFFDTVNYIGEAASSDDAPKS